MDGCVGTEREAGDTGVDEEYVSAAAAWMGGAGAGSMDEGGLRQRKGARTSGPPRAVQAAEGTLTGAEQSAGSAPTKAFNCSRTEPGGEFACSRAVQLLTLLAVEDTLASLELFSIWR